MERGFSLIEAQQIVMQALQRLEVSYRQTGEDEFRLTTEWGARPIIYVSPNDEMPFKRRHQRASRLKTSQYYVVIVKRGLTIADIQETVSQYLDGLQKGDESERLADKALEQVRRKRPSLIVDSYKTDTAADVAGSDFCVGIPNPCRTGSIFWIGLQIKSSIAGAEAEVRKWRQQARNRGSSQGERMVRRVIVVPQEGSEEDRITETARRIILELDRMRESLETGYEARPWIRSRSRAAS